MTRTDPPNPTPGPDWPAAPQPLHEQIETLGALLGRLIRRGDRPMIEHGIKAMRARLDEAELNVRGLAPDAETELAPAGIDWSGLLAPTQADDRAMRAAYRNMLGLDRATDTGTDGPAHWRALRGAAQAFAYRLAQRLPELAPAVANPLATDDDVEAPRCAHCGAVYDQPDADAGHTTCEYHRPTPDEVVEEPALAGDETTGPDGDECSQDCVCRR